jgi:hypothetical protein
VLTRKPRKGDVIRSPESEGRVSRVEGDFVYFELTRHSINPHGKQGTLGETSFIWRFLEGLNENFTIVGEWDNAS